MVVCAACGVESPDGFRFCPACGALLAGERVNRRERRVVSVLFADLVGFTSRSEQLDVEDVEGLLRRYHRLLRRELEGHGGTVEKFIGDAVMALFGAPVAHEDDPERAVRAALSIQDAIAELRELDGVDLHVRVGVTTGEALIALGARPESGEGMASGDVVNTAARLQSAAPSDCVLVDERTHRATDRTIIYAEAEAVTAKGKAEPVAVWLARQTRSFMPEQARLDDLPLVGRATELTLLTGALERSQREPSTQLVTVIGEPGIGKTRLVEELGAHIDVAPELITWRRGRSLAYGEGVALWALGEMVKLQAGILESDSAASARAKVAESVAAVIVSERDRAWVARHLQPLVGLEAAAQPAEGDRVEAFAAWRRFFEALAEDGPTVLVFEDVHWADDALLDFIDLLADRAGAVPLLIVCTARPELLERRPAWGGGKINAQTLNLTPLSQDDTARLVGALLDQSLLPAETQSALLERAEGNPLYAQEYVRMLRDRDLLVRDGGGWRLVAEPEGLPESVQGIIAARLDTLADAERQLVQDAAVVGKTAWVGAVCAIGERSAWDTEELVHALERKQLLRRSRRSSVADELEFSFAHALTRDVAYGQIRRADRAEKHERTAAWIERLAGDREDKAELLAHHYTTALGLRRQSGEQTPGLVEKARTALAEAGRRAEAVNAHAAAAEHLRAALDLTPQADPSRPRLLFDRVKAGYHAGDTESAALEAARDAQVAARDWDAAAELSQVMADLSLLHGGSPEDAQRHVAEALQYAARIGYAPVSSRIATVQAYGLLTSGKAREALELTAEALRRAEAAGDVKGRARLLAWHGDARISTGDSRGIDEMEEAAETLAAEGDSHSSAVYTNLAEHLLAYGEVGRAAEARARSAALSERFGQPRQIAHSVLARSDSAYHAGEWELALVRIGPALEMPVPEITAQACWTRGRILLARDDLRGALQDADQLVEFATISGNDELLFQGLALRARIHDAQADMRQAGDDCRRFLARWAETGGMFIQTPALGTLVVAPQAHTDMAGAVSLLPDESSWKHAIRATIEGRYADAAAIYREMGSLPMQADLHSLAARSAAAGGRDREAACHAGHALTFYRSVGAKFHIAQIERLLREIA